MKTPFEKLSNRKPEIEHLRVFGTEAYINVPTEKQKKFKPNSKKVTVVGYDGESRIVKLLIKMHHKLGSHGTEDSEMLLIATDYLLLMLLILCVTVTSVKQCQAQKQKSGEVQLNKK